jgi:hypothetical protein
LTGAGAAVLVGMDDEVSVTTSTARFLDGPHSDSSFRFDLDFNSDAHDDEFDCDTILSLGWDDLDRFIALLVEAWDRVALLELDLGVVVDEKMSSISDATAAFPLAATGVLLFPIVDSVSR